MGGSPGKTSTSMAPLRSWTPSSSRSASASSRPIATIAVVVGLAVGLSVIIPYIGAALVTLPFAYVGEVAWNLAWLVYLPIAAILRRRGSRAES